MRAVWSSPGNSTIQGVNNASFVRSNNTLSRELAILQEELQRKHQEEDVATLTTTVYKFDANSGSAGTASWIFPNRRDFNNRREV